MLLQNISRYAENPIRVSGYKYADVLTKIGYNLSNHMNKYIGDAGIGFETFNGIPDGYSHPYAWGNPIQGGGLAARVSGEGDISNALLAGGKGLEAVITGTGTISNAALALIVSFSATISGSGGVNYANLKGIVQLLATVYGSGEITKAELGVIVGLAAHIYGVGSVNAELFGNAFLSAHIYVNEGSADVTQLVAGVWDAVASQYNATGTMGAKLNDAGGGSSPEDIADAVWDELVATHGNTGSFGELLSNIDEVTSKKLLTKALWLALKS